MCRKKDKWKGMRNGTNSLVRVEKLGRDDDEVGGIVKVDNVWIFCK